MLYQLSYTPPGTGIAYLKAKPGCGKRIFGAGSGD